MLTEPGGRAFTSSLYALAIGQVADNKDPNDLGRVRVLFPTLSTPSEGGGAPNDELRTSGWFRVVRPLAAQSGEFFNLPDVGDEVVVGFLDGDVEFGVVLGQLSSLGDKPHEDIYVPAKIEGQELSPASKERQDTFENHRRVWRSRLGHMIVLDDTPDAPMLQLFNPDKSLAIVFDEKKECMLLVNTKTDIVIDAKRDIKLKAGQNFVLEAAQSVTIDAKKGDLSISAGGTGKVAITGALDIDGATITLN